MRAGKSGQAELPRYVHRVTKRRKSGPPHHYYFYTRHRNTPEAWPSIALPEPMTKEFVDAHAVCAALERAEGRFYLFGKEMPRHGDKAFWKVAAEVMEAKEKRDHQGAMDFSALVDAFNNDLNPIWRDLSKSTKRGYVSYGKMIKEAWAFDLPSELTAVDAQQAIDALGDTPATANQFRAYLSRLMAWGVPRGYSANNPVVFTDKAPKGEPWKPWPEWAFETLLEHAPMTMLMPAISALFTGQRQGDVIAMRRPRESDGLLEVRAQKTKKTVWIPVHREYREWMEKAPKGDSPLLHLGARGLPFASADSFRTEWQKMMDKPAFKRFREERMVFHGLRKNAVINLLEVGCTEAQVGAIVNMSEQMVRHYGREVNLRVLAKGGMTLLENRWAEVRPEVFGTRTERELRTGQQNWKPSTPKRGG